jgi:hypothetical protein
MGVHHIFPLFYFGAWAPSDVGILEFCPSLGVRGSSTYGTSQFYRTLATWRTFGRTCMGVLSLKLQVCPRTNNRWRGAGVFNKHLGLVWGAVVHYPKKSKSLTVCLQPPHGSLTGLYFLVSKNTIESNNTEGVEVRVGGGRTRERGVGPVSRAVVQLLPTTGCHADVHYHK